MEYQQKQAFFSLLYFKIKLHLKPTSSYIRHGYYKDLLNILINLLNHHEQNRIYQCCC